MDKIYFYFDGRHYAGEIVISTTQEPHYYWCFLDNDELIKDLGDCVPFVKIDHAITPVEFYPPKYKLLLQAIAEAITRYLETLRL